MCVICFKNLGAELSREDASLMWEANDHGAGYALWDETSQDWLVKKGFMSFEGLWKEIEPYCGRDHILVVHFRIASRGKVVPDLTHPFPIEMEGGKTAWLFHNGTLSIVPEGGLSDTAQFAKELSQLRLNKEQLKTLLSGKLGDELRGHSRFAVVFPGEREPLLLGSWEEADGLKVSNLGWRRTYSFPLDYGLGGYGLQSRSYWDLPDTYGYCELGRKKDLPKFVRAGVLTFEKKDGCFYFVPSLRGVGKEGRLLVKYDSLYIICEGQELFADIELGGEPELAVSPEGEIYRLHKNGVAKKVGVLKSTPKAYAGKRPVSVGIPDEEGILYVLQEGGLVEPYLLE